MSEATKRLRRWATEVEEAYGDGGYATGDGPVAPLDEVLAVLAENERLRDALRQIAEHAEAHRPDIIADLAHEALDDNQDESTGIMRTERETAAMERLAHEVVYLAYASEGPAPEWMRGLVEEVLPGHVIEEFREPPPMFNG